MAKHLEIRNSTAEFLTFVAEGKEDGVQVLYQDETLWATQQAMSVLFDVKVPTINYHLSQIFKDGELQEDRTIRKIRIVQRLNPDELNYQEQTFCDLFFIRANGVVPLLSYSSQKTNCRIIHL